MTLENLKNDLPETVIFSLDIAQERTGWALLQGPSVLEYGFISRPSEFAKINMKSPLFCDWLAWYKNAIWELIERIEYKASFAIESVVMEDMNMKFKFNAGKALMQFQAAAKIACSEKNLYVNMINNITVKAFYKVKTRKKLFSPELVKQAKDEKVPEVKIQMVNVVNKLWGLKLTYQQNDEADAIAQAFTHLVKRNQ